MNVLRKLLKLLMTAFCEQGIRLQANKDKCNAGQKGQGNQIRYQTDEHVRISQEAFF